MKNPNKIMLLILLTLAPSLVMAAVSDELKRFNKCYGIFVGERVLTSDPLWKAVEAGSKTGTAACMEIFDKATLTANGKIAYVNGVPNEIGPKVLNTFLRFQQSQLQVPDYAFGIGIWMNRFLRDIVDINEASYHFVYSLFSPSEPFSKTVTRDYSLRAVRHSAYPVRTESVTVSALPSTFEQVIPNTEDMIPFKPTLIQTGTFVGLVKDNIKNIANAYKNSKDFTDLNINQHHGAGAMGTQSYLIGNIGKEGYSNGGNNLFRRWGKHVIEDYLCRDLPALRTTDVIQEVNISSKIVFRNGISCMGCHSTMDTMAAVLRNGKSAQITPYYNRSSSLQFFGVRAPTGPITEMPVLDNDPNFYKSPPEGRLFYRSYDGSVVKEEVDGLQQLGEAIADTNDFYVCAAKRYYRFLTGIDVDLADSGNINTPPFTQGVEYQRNKVIDLGLDLKTHQSGRLLIKKIIEQKAFIYPDQGV